MSRNKKGILLSILGILGLIIITIGVTYAFFNYAKEGTTENSITSGTITFLYTEVSEVGRGISIQDAYPMSDEIGKVQVGEGKVFDFKITSNTSSSTSIPYEVTARKKNTSTLDENVVKLYLTEVDGSLEEELLLDNYSNLVQTTRVDSNRYIEKTIYEGTVPVNSVNYEKNFRLRMWIGEDTDFGPVKGENVEDIYPYNGKEFTLTVNVYANGKVVTEEEGHTWNFEYTGEEDIFVVPMSGQYKLEVWGASGGNADSYTGGAGGYSNIVIDLKKNTPVYINVGQVGESVSGRPSSNPYSAYNGGGRASGQVENYYGSGSGGATHIALTSGILSSLSNSKESVLLVAGGGGGASSTNTGNSTTYGNGGAGGGTSGVDGNNISFTRTVGKGATSETAGISSNDGGKYPDIDSGFGQGCLPFISYDLYLLVAGGAGYYGGGCGSHSGGGGGSGYISSSNGITLSGIEEIPTYDGTSTMIGNIGNGYAKITYLGN